MNFFTYWSIRVHNNTCLLINEEIFARMEGTICTVNRVDIKALKMNLNRGLLMENVYLSSE